MKSKIKCEISKVFFLFVFLTLRAMAEAPAVSCGLSNVSTNVEMLQDKTLSNGVTHSVYNTYFTAAQPNLGDQCRTRWANKFPGLAKSKWVFTEIAEKTYFCENNSTPTISALGSLISYSSADNSKRIEIDKNASTLRYVYDTSTEWRGGYNLTLNNNNSAPKFALNDLSTKWPHLLLRQDLVDPKSADGKLWLNGYHSLKFKTDVKWNAGLHLAPPKCSPACSSTSWGSRENPVSAPITDHALMYAAFVLKHRNSPAAQPTGLFDGQAIYALVPLLYTEDGSTHKDGTAPYLDGDQLGNQIGGVGANPVYFSPYPMHLQLGKQNPFDIDIPLVAREAVAAANVRSRLKAPPGAYHELNANDYYVDYILIGWEIWGAYKTDITFTGLSIQGTTYSQHKCETLHQYWNASKGDHYYTRDHIPGGFMDYVYEKPLGLISVAAGSNTKPIYRYWSTALGDHLYLNELYPIPNDDPNLAPLGYVYEGKTGEAFVTPPSEGTYKMIYRYWSAGAQDHYYTSDYYPGGFPGYVFDGFSIGYLKAP